jgi:hypothetical protein
MALLTYSVGTNVQTGAAVESFRNAVIEARYAPAFEGSGARLVNGPP